MHSFCRRKNIMSLVVRIVIILVITLIIIAIVAPMKKKYIK